MIQPFFQLGSFNSHRQIQNPIANVNEIQVIPLLARVPRFWM